jgi:phage FluMu protein Com
MLTESFKVKCPNCGIEINVPYIKEIKPTTPEGIDREIARTAIEVEYTLHKISWDERCKLLEGLEE